MHVHVYVSILQDPGDGYQWAPNNLLKSGAKKKKKKKKKHQLNPRWAKQQTTNRQAPVPAN